MTQKISVERCLTRLLSLTCGFGDERAAWLEGEGKVRRLMFARSVTERGIEGRGSA